MKYITKLVPYKILGYIECIYDLTRCNFYNIYISYVKLFILLMSISLMSLFSEIIKSDETNWELQVDYLFNQKRKPSKQKLNW